MWLPDLSRFHGPRYHALTMALVEAIRNGRLQPDERLPPQRLLADLLGVHLSTVTRAYREAAQLGLIGGDTRRGTRVLPPSTAARLFALADRGEAPAIDLSSNTPPQRKDDDLDRALANLATSGPLAERLAYRAWQDWAPHRAALLQWLAPAGLGGDPGQVTLTAGAQHAIAEVLCKLVRGGETILCEAMTYPGLKSLAQQQGWRLAGLPMDEEGVDPEALERAFQRGVARIAVLNPTLHNPTTRSLSLERREAVVAVARRHGATLVEEDVYGLLADPPLPALAALGPDCTIHVNGLSKTVAPGLRLGCIIDGTGRGDFGEANSHRTTWYVNPLLADVALHWLADGTAAERLCWQRSELAARHDLLRRTLAAQGSDLPVQGPSAAPHVWLPAAPGMTGERWCRRLAVAGVVAVPDSAFATRQPPAVPGLRLSLGAAAGREEIAAAARRVAAVKLR